jgi:hypothetical protein
MTFTSETKNKINSINEQIESDKLANMVKLSQQNLGLAIILSVVFPIGGYVYTRRGLSFLGFILGGVALSIAVHAIEPQQQKADSMAWTFCSLYGSIVAPIDNGRAIACSRKS